ncbi:VCBS repeat-containing protein [archaeon]|jgi:hypothetical protein|nr:VCBS repeat-containing protein [archaeon]MBT6182846.1 VCBS repeat-containing protein [archaeon]MBT6606806.1 VCBS repeat-containing protein [archaeon]MBT7251721.1 VCBS repeat-containing protein [archaeon]MBT7660504.1 VCBS repeat-containing protein [archaeon]
MKKGAKKKNSKNNSIRTLNRKELFFILGLVLLISIFANVILSKEYLQKAPPISNVRSAGTSTSVGSVKKPIPQLAGWPKQLGGEPGSPHIIEDLDNDGIKELIVRSDPPGLVTVLDSQGNNKPGWPIQIISGTISVGDVTGNGNKELVFVSVGKLYVYDSLGNLLPGWPSKTIATFPSVSAAALIDLNNDGIKDIVYAGGSSVANPNQELVAYNYQGNFLPGFPTRLKGSSKSTVAVGDINLDGKNEIIVASNFKLNQQLSTIDDIYLEAFDNLGIKLWDKQIPYGFTLPPVVPASIGNLDGDSELEIVFPGYDGEIYALNHDGSPLQGWSSVSWGANWILSPAAIGDIDEDGLNEIISYRGPYLYALENNGAIKWSKYKFQDFNGGYVRASPIISDITGDGKMEVLVSTEGFSNSGIFAFDGGNGNLLNQFPLKGGPQLTSFQRSAPLITDFDLDGDIEIIVGGDDGNIYVWDLTSPYNPNLIYWETLQQNSERTGVAI